MHATRLDAISRFFADRRVAPRSTLRSDAALGVTSLAAVSALDDTRPRDAVTPIFPDAVANAPFLFVESGSIIPH